MTSWRKPDGFDTASITLADVQAKTARFCEPFRSANAWVPEDSKVYINNVTYWEPVPWDNRKGMVTLAGDAAHAMSFRKFTLHVLLREHDQADFPTLRL